MKRRAPYPRRAPLAERKSRLRPLGRPEPSRAGRRPRSGGPSRLASKRTARRLRQTVRGLWRTLQWTVSLAALAVGVTVAGKWAYRYYNTSDTFVLRHVVCTGNRYLSTSRLMEQMGLELGKRLFQLPVKAMRDSLERHPWVRSAHLRRRWPSTLRIQVRERVPLVLSLRDDGGEGWMGLTGGGRWLLSIPWDVEGLPVLEGGSTVPAPAATDLGVFLSTAREGFEGIYNAISQVRYTGSGECALYSRDNRLVFLIALDNPARATLAFWERLMRQAGGEFREGQTVDLRVVGHAYVS